MRSEAEVRARLRTARKHLGIANALVQISASNAKPFARSKFLNVLGKEINQLKIELLVFLGELDKNEKLYWEFKNQPSLQILKNIEKLGGGGEG